MSGSIQYRETRLGMTSILSISEIKDVPKRLIKRNRLHSPFIAMTLRHESHNENEKLNEILMACRS